MPFEPTKTACPEALAIHSLSNEQMTKTTVYLIINLFTCANSVVVSTVIAFRRRVWKYKYTISFIVLSVSILADHIFFFFCFSFSQTTKWCCASRSTHVYGIIWYFCPFRAAIKHNHTSYTDIAVAAATAVPLLLLLKLKIYNVNVAYEPSQQFCSLALWMWECVCVWISRDICPSFCMFPALCQSQIECQICNEVDRDARRHQLLSGRQRQQQWPRLQPQHHQQQ